ncbi:hypothetical protein [Pedomonas sp. V897]|uniref:hypothetical protein n=1 Tax=Pedomonas sp. V897 TaxID=3446482 RepID=UPI003EE0F9E4
MAKQEFDDLLSRMGAIAEAVNAFQSEIVQKEAFTALIAAFANGTVHARQLSIAQPLDFVEPASNDEAAVVEVPTAKSVTGKQRVKKSKNGGTAKAEWALVKELNLRPEGKKSFYEFIDEKKPKSNEDKYAVIVYYLQHILKLPAVSINEVGTVFRLVPAWREPKSVMTGLRVAASRKATIDTSNFEDIKTTPHGRNFVEHDLPAPEKPKK